MTGNKKEKYGIEKNTLVTNRITHLAGYPLEDLLKLYQKDLFEDFLPYMEEHVYDPQYGGFMCHIGRNGRHVSTDKRTWYDGRGVWVYGTLYQHFGQNPLFLEKAQKSLDFLMSMKATDYPFWAWGYSRSGIPIANHQADIYGSLFVAEGLAAMAVATGEVDYWRESVKILRDGMVQYDRDSYEYVPHYESGNLVEAPRVLGHWMIFLNLSGHLLEFRETEELNRISDRCIEAILGKHLHPEFDLLIEYLNHDGTLPDSPLDQFAYLGHGIEVLWMLMAEALRRGDDALYQEASRLFKRHVEVAWDPVYGGILHELTHVGENSWLLEKVLWAQEEGLTGLMLMIATDQDAWAIRWFGRIYPYVREHFILHDHPARLMCNGGDRKMEIHHQVDRFENYHHPRHLMLNLRRLQTIVHDNLNT